MTMDATERIALREKAREHQASLDERRLYFSPQQLATRWGVGVTTVKSIARDRLPFKEFGNGAKLKRRRYHRDDVLAFEAEDRQPEARSA